MAARSTTSGTPVKSCKSTRAGLNGISTGGRCAGLPAGQVLDVLLGDLKAVAIAQGRLQQHADREGQIRDPRQPLVFQLRQSVQGGLAATGVERVAGPERVRLACRAGHDFLSLQATKLFFSSYLPLQLPAAERAEIVLQPGRFVWVRPLRPWPGPIDPSPVTPPRRSVKIRMSGRDLLFTPRQPTIAMLPPAPTLMYHF